tara:strand:+ start:931 stop:1863 length:933 start_codon:yes stop_codon:yes gene_type:complete
VANQEIEKDVGGTLVFLAPYAPIASATSTIHEPDGDQIASVTPSLPPSTALNGAHAAGITTLTVDSTSGFVVGDHYFLGQDRSDQKVQEHRGEWLRVKFIVSTTQLELYDATNYAFADNDVIAGNKITGAVSAAQSDDLDEGYEWRVSYTLRGETSAKKSIVQYDVVRSVWPEKLLANYELRQYLGELGASIMESVALTGTDFEDDIRIATTTLKAHIEERGYRPSRFRSHDEFKRPLALLCILEWAKRGENIPKAWRDVPEQYLDMAQLNYREALNTALNTCRSYDEDESGVVSVAEKERKLGVLRLVR